MNEYQAVVAGTRVRSWLDPHRPHIVVMSDDIMGIRELDTTEGMRVIIEDAYQFLLAARFRYKQAVDVLRLNLEAYKMVLRCTDETVERYFALKEECVQYVSPHDVVRFMQSEGTLCIDQNLPPNPVLSLR